VTKSKMH